MSPKNNHDVNASSTTHGIGTRGFGAPQPNLATNPEVLARLEWLDDLMFAAIDGDPVALETVIDAWRKALADLGRHTLEESRLQYLRRAQGVWHELRRQPNHPPHKVFAAIEIISLLAGRMW